MQILVIFLEIQAARFTWKQENFTNCDLEIKFNTFRSYFDYLTSIAFKLGTYSSDRIRKISEIVIILKFQALRCLL